VRGHFPSGSAANKEYSFILLHTSADKRSGGVSGAPRGGQGPATGHGVRAVDSSLATRHLSLPSCPVAGPRERAGKSRTGTNKTRTCALPAPFAAMCPLFYLSQFWGAVHVPVPSAPIAAIAVGDQAQRGGSRIECGERSSMGKPRFREPKRLLSAGAEVWERTQPGWYNRSILYHMIANQFKYNCS
jgi:hypothetical protein